MGSAQKRPAVSENPGRSGAEDDPLIKAGLTSDRMSNVEICPPAFALCLILCSSREPKQLLLHLIKRSHGCQRVHIVPPLHNLSALDGNDRDESVVV
jgi:hypothetical protein